MAEFAITYEELLYVGVFVASCVIGLIAALVFVAVECVCQRPRMHTGAIIGWAVVIFLAFAATGTCLAAVAVFQFPVAAGVIMMFLAMLAILWTVVYFTSSAFRPSDGGSAGGKRVSDRSCVGCLSIAQMRPAAFVACVILAIVWALTAVWLRDLCVVLYPSGVSVWLSRYSLPPEERCEARNGLPCHVYFTLSDTGDVLIVNFHNRISGIDDSRTAYARWSYNTDDGGGPASNNGTSSQATGFVLKYEDIPYHTSREFRAVSWVYIGPGLTRNTSITVSVSLGGSVWSKAYRVRTLPATDVGLRFVAGGDSGVETAALQLYNHAAATEPHFAMHGGDIAYGNGIVNCVSRWDLWFHQWENYMLTPTGYSIPVVLAIGNHEGGGYQLGTSRSYFFKFFVQGDDESASYVMGKSEMLLLLIFRPAQSRTLPACNRARHIMCTKSLMRLL